MLAAHGCTPRPDHTTLVLLPRSVARAATMLGASVAGTCKQMDPEMAETAITLFESGMEASAALKAAQLLGV